MACSVNSVIDSLKCPDELPESPVVKQLIDQVIQSLEDQIIGKLKSHGFEFENRDALIAFSKERLKVIQSGHQKYLYLDNNILIASWSEKFSHETLYDEKTGKTTATISLGKI